jgi:DNA-binding transcriptional MocR family regulator
MLQKLIKLITGGQVYSQADLARQLGVSEGLVVQMMEDLSRMGYLKRVDAGIGGSCSACPIGDTCVSETCAPVSSGGQMWVPTEKALAAGSR